MNSILPSNLASKKIILVGPLPPPSGGMANQTVQLFHLLQTTEIEVQLIQSNAPYIPAWIGKIPILRAFFRLVPYKIRLWKACKKADIIHIMANSGWSWHLFVVPAIFIAKLHGVKVLVHYHGGEASQFFKAHYRWIKPALNKVDQVIVPSGFLEKIFLKYQTPSIIIKNIIDLTRFNPTSKIFNPSQPHFIVTRNLEAIYDIPTALKAFSIVLKEYPKATITIAGSGTELTALHSLAETLGITDAVHFSGRIPNEDLPFLYQKSQLMLNPSTKDNMPISILEALASGIPCISTNAGGIPDLVEDGVTARLCNVGDAEKMAELALELLADSIQYQRLRENGLKFVTDFTWEKVSLSLFAVYQKI